MRSTCRITGRWAHGHAQRSITPATKAGIRAFLAEQCNVAGRTTVVLYQKDHGGWNAGCGWELSLTAEPPAVRPFDAVALLAAIDNAITRVRHYVRDRLKPRAPDEIIVVIHTASRKKHTFSSFDLSPARTYISELRTRMPPTRFILLTASADVFNGLGPVGFDPATVLYYRPDLSEAALLAASQMIHRGGHTGHYAFTDEDRARTCP